MKYSIEHENDVVVIVLKGSLEGGTDTYDLKDAITAELGKGARKFVIDMGKASFVNSTGIGVLVAVQVSVDQSEGALKVCNVSDRARRAFVVTGVWQIFEAYESRAEAIGAFKS